MNPPSVSAAIRPRILLIEDSDDIRFFLTSLLADAHEVMAAASGQQGLEMALSTERPDLILLDVVMPDMNGYEVMEKLRHQARSADIPVIFLTALSSVEEEQRGLDMGATDYIFKPISPPILLARVKLHLERSANAQRLKALSEQLSRYLAPQVYQSLFDGSRQAEIQTQRKRLTVFFSDIKNFTASTAQWQPEEVTLLLNSYLEEMSLVAADFGGTLDKFIGDAIVIFFGDPHTLGPREDALQCVRMAVAMQQRLKELQVRWRAMGIHKIFEIRIGINSGYCDVGNFGSKLRMDYTIIGREVNLAARLEQAAEPGEILISAETHALVRDDIESDPRPPVVAKGFAEPITVHAVRQPRLTAGAPDVIRCNRPGLRLDMDVGQLTGMARTEAAADLRAALARLEATPGAVAGLTPVAVPVAAQASPQPAPHPTTPDLADQLLAAPIAGLDIALGLTRAMGMKALYASMLQRYRDGRRQSARQIRDAIAAGDLAGAEGLAHSLRGMSAQIGATAVAEGATALEHGISAKAPVDQLMALLDQMEPALSSLLAALDAAFERAHRPN
ncbi:adenylate/guanylate cyclase domain-containing protein [Polaromonas sp. YR568]|uniref:response regulator n=1 Tax=Polaromonas sp. YR568 TaxID=1855301 RepID=UPI003137C192